MGTGRFHLFETVKSCVSKRPGEPEEENNNIMSRYDHKIETSLEGIEHLSKEKKEKKEREKPLLFKRHKAVRFLISPKIKKVKIEVNKIMNPAFLLGTAFNIAYWHRKYHSGTICKGVSNPPC